MKKHVIKFLLWMLVSIAQAEALTSPSINTSPENVITADSGLINVGLAVLQDDITPDQTPDNLTLTPQQLHEAQVWSLTLDQEKRYVSLMQNKTGLYYSDDHLSPVWILGLNARSTEERTYFAALAAIQERQLIAQNLAWNNAYTGAYRTLTKGQPLIRLPEIYPQKNNSVDLQAGDQLNFFINTSDAVGTTIQSLLKQLKNYSSMTLNLFFVGEPSNSDIQAWARRYNIPMREVKTGQITLNQGNTAWKQLNINATPPVLVLTRNHTSQQVNLENLP